MPSNVFETTGTNVSILFLDKSIENQEILLMDASKLGIKTKDEKIKKQSARRYSDHQYL